MERLVLGLDIGGTHTRMGLVTEAGELTGFQILKTKALAEKGFLDALAEEILAFIRAQGAAPLRVSMGFPSAIDKACRTLLNTPNIPGLNNIAIVDEMESRLGLPVCVSRDVIMLYQYDKLRYALPQEGVVLGVYVGTGIGNVIEIDGSILPGRHGIAAELGHIPVWDKHDLCGCGVRGCAEMYAGGMALAKLREQYFPETTMEELFARHADSEAVLQYLSMLTLPIATEITILDPEAVVLGGGVLYMQGFPRERFETLLKQRLRVTVAQDLRLIYSLPAQQNGVIGAGLYGFAR